MSEHEYVIKGLEPKSQELFDYPVGEAVTENTGFVVFKTLRLLQYANAKLGYHDLSQHYSAVVDNLLVLYDMIKELHFRDLTQTGGGDE